MVLKFPRCNPEDKTDEWRDIRGKLFGKAQEIRAQYSQEFAKEYLSHDSDSNFILKKSHNKLTLSSENKFNRLTSKELDGIYERIEERRNNGKYEVVYHFKKMPDEFFVVNNILNEISEMNGNAKIKHGYEFPEESLSETTKSGRKISSNISVLGKEDIFYYDSLAGEKSNGELKDRTNLTMLFKTSFKFPVGIDGYDVRVEKGRLASNKDLQTLTYSIPREAAEFLEEPILEEIARQN